VSALVRSELLKIRTTRGWYAYLTVVVLLVGVAVAGDIGSSPDAERSLLEFQLGLVDSAGFAALLSIILGITIVTTEFRHGTITPTFLVEPQRERVVAAKAAAVSLVAALFALLALVVAAAVALTWLSIIGADLHLGDAEIGKRAAQAVLLGILWGLLGLAIGALVHSQVAALVGTLIWIFLGETLLLGFFGLLDLDGARAYLPFQALDGADGTGGADLLSYWPAVGVSLGWIALLGAAGIVRTQRRDIT
jgi:ABC-type transport system involved in multi-copper enzyme maturation permease subunit